MAALALGLVACAGPPAVDGGENAGGFAAYQVNLPGGDTVTCVANTASSRGGIDCNWDAVNG